MVNSVIVGGAVGFGLGYLAGKMDVTNNYPDITKRIKVMSGTKVLTSRVVSSGIVSGKPISTYLLQVDGNTEAVLDIWGGNRIEISRLTWNQITIYVDDVLKYTMALVTADGVSSGYCSFSI